MANLPPKYIIDEIAGLAGKARISYPGSNTSVKRVERIHRAKKDDWELAFGSPDEEFSSAKLVSQMKLKEDGKYVDVYRAWETLPGVILTGQERDDVLDISIPYTEQKVPKGTAAPDARITPIDDVHSIKREDDLEAFGDAVEGIHLQIPTQESISLPPVLEGVKIIWGGQSSDGYSTVRPTYQASSWIAGMVQAITFGGSASASATIDSDVTFRVRDGFSGAVPAVLHLFFLPIATASEADILTKVGASPWPILRLTSRNLVVIGRHRALDVSGRVTVSSVSSTAGVEVLVSSTKTGERRSGGVSVKSIPIPAALCGELTVEEEGSSSILATATVKRETPVIAGYDKDGVPISPSVTPDYSGWPEAELSVDVEAEGSFSPATIPATTPAVFPTGRYLISSKASPYRHGWLQVTAVTVEIDETMV